MYPVSLPTPVARKASGFTLIESMVALAIFGILLAVGVPRMTDWISATKAANAASFYAEAFAMGRTQALANNSQSRVVFANGANGQPGWQVDICFRTSARTCMNESDWSTTGAAAPGAAGAASAYRSVARASDTLPATSILNVALDAGNADDVYFTPFGWVDTSRVPRVTRIDLSPPASQAGAFRPSAVVLTLGGVTMVCDPNPQVLEGDSRRCPQ